MSKCKLKTHTHTQTRTYADTQKDEGKQRRQVCSIYYRTAAIYQKYKDLNRYSRFDVSRNGTFAYEATVVMP